MPKIVATALCALLIATVSLAAGSAQSPVTVVLQLQQALTQTVEDSAEHEQTLARVVRDTHDFEAIARISVGAHWQALNEAQRQQLLTRISQLSIALYASRFAGANAMHFSTPEITDQNTAQATVRSQLITTDGDSIAFQYMLRHTDGRWRIVNILANGISELAIRRSEYTSILQREGVDDLLQRLEAQIRELEQESG